MSSPPMRFFNSTPHRARFPNKLAEGALPDISLKVGKDDGLPIESGGLGCKGHQMAVEGLCYRGEVELRPTGHDRIHEVLHDQAIPAAMGSAA
ncbi:MAG: hypothetical protein NTW91_06850 [Verrucomicrobia bacterium]|nr:hypothetical protein [Verrucomicrobiota bacterium]